jgi:hypothetical protein
MLTAAVIILLVWSICLVLVMVFRGSHVTPAAPPAAELSKAPDEESVADSRTVEASTKSQLLFERM